MKISHVSALAGALLSVLPAPSPAAAAAGNGDDTSKAAAIIAKNTRNGKPDWEKGRMRMAISDKRGETRTRQLIQLTMTGKDGLQRRLLRFLEPAEVNMSTFLTIQNKGRDDDRWLYLPVLRRERRISASGQSGSFMSSDFTFEDISPVEPEEFKYAYRGEQPCDGAVCHVIQATPLKRDDREYSHKELWIDTANFTTRKVDFHKDGKVFKVFRASGMENVDGSGFWRPKRVEMENLRAGTRTTMEFTGMSVNAKIPAELFEKRFLDKPWNL